MGDKKKEKKEEKVYISKRITGYSMEVSDGKHTIYIERKDDICQLLTDKRLEAFCFSNTKTKQTLVRWRAIAYLILAACRELE